MRKKHHAKTTDCISFTHAGLEMRGICEANSMQYAARVYFFILISKNAIRCLPLVTLASSARRARKAMYVCLSRRSQQVFIEAVIASIRSEPQFARPQFKGRVNGGGGGCCIRLVGRMVSPEAPIEQQYEFRSSVGARSAKQRCRRRRRSSGRYGVSP